MVKKKILKVPKAVQRKHQKRVRDVFQKILKIVYRGGFPVVDWSDPMNVERMPEGQKWVSGSGTAPLLKNNLLGMAVMRALDGKNEPHRQVLGCKLYLVWKGRVVLRLENKNYYLRKGDFLFAPPLCLQQVKHMQKGSVLLLFRSPDVGNTKFDKLDKNGDRFGRGQLK